MPPVKAEHGQVYNKVFADASGNSYNAQSAVEIIENNNQFVWVEEKARWFSPNGKRQIWFEDGWKYDGGSGVIEEFTIINKYSDAVGTTPTVGNKSFMQGHHGIQSEWAEKCLGSYYNKNEAPAILLRDTFKDTPHQILTALQKDRKKTGSYFKQREYFKSDCKILGIPDEIRDLYLEKADAYFSEIYNQMLSDNILSKSEIDAKFEFNLIK